MSGKSVYLEQMVLNTLFRNGTFTKPATLYVSLHTADPTDAGTGPEVSGGAYARVAVANATNFSAPTSGSGGQQVSNSVDIVFSTPTANWGTVTYFGIWTAATAGSMLYSGPLDTPRTINTGDQAPTFAAGTLQIAES